MIYAVDDEAVHLTTVRTALEEKGYEVVTFSSAGEALQRYAQDDPELIISDIMMPVMGGFEFRQALVQGFPDRTTPFIFLSSDADPDAIVHGLELGADDYLIKPVDQRVLLAKIRTILRRAGQRARSVFSGDLSLYPFINVVRFCELQGLTGEVAFSSGSFDCVLAFKAGAPRLDEVDDADNLLATLCDLEGGSFEIRSLQVDFGELESVARTPDTGHVAKPSQGGRPMGRLSGLEAGDRLFQIQTEMTSYPEGQILTVVILDGNTVLKRAQPAPEGAAREELEQLIEKQHGTVEDEVRGKLAELAKKKAGDDSSAKEKYYQLFEAGFEAYRKQELEQAVQLWEQARELIPGESTLEINLRIARAKLDATS